MTIGGLFLVNAGLSFVLSLAVAMLLGPNAYGRYALALAIAAVVTTTLFEWLRLSTTRFYSERVRGERPEVRATLRRGYRAAAAALGIATLAAVSAGMAGGRDFGLPVPLIVAAAAASLALGLFDFATALARARFLDGAYALLVGSRAVLACTLATAAAWLWGHPAPVLAASALAAVAAIALVRRRLGDPVVASARPRRRLALDFARYAIPLVAASALYQLLPVVNRAILASREGFAEAGYFGLASELGMRLFQNLGAALDLVLFQLAVRADEQHGRAQADRQIGRNIGAIVAVVFPAATGLVMVLPSFEAVFVPPAYRGHVAPTMDYLVPALAAFAIVQYALNPVFQLRGRMAAVIAAAVAAVTVDIALVEAWPGLGGPPGFAAAQLAAMAAAFAILGLTAVRSHANLPWRDIAVSAGASLVMALAIWPIGRLGPSWQTMLLQVVAGLAAYAALALASDLAGARTLLSLALARRRGAAPT